MISRNEEIPIDILEHQSPLDAILRLLFFYLVNGFNKDLHMSIWPKMFLPALLTKTHFSRNMSWSTVMASF